MANADIVCNLAEIRKGDQFCFNGKTHVAMTDAELTETDLGKEWNVLVDDPEGTDYVWASECGGFVARITGVRVSVSLSVEDDNGEYTYIGEESVYSKEADAPEDVDINDLIFQALELERIYSGNVLVDKRVETLDGEYIDSDEFELAVDITLTEELTPYIDWNKCSKALSPIYKIDREKSTLRNTEFLNNAGSDERASLADLD